MARADLCLNCGDNRATDESALCGECNEHMQMGGYRGDGL
jgi:hypothetical protein